MSSETVTKSAKGPQRTEIRRKARALCSSVGSVLLDVPVARRLLNSALCARGCVSSRWFPRFFDSSNSARSFLWRCEFRGRKILIPVVPAFPQSWSIAYSMHWHEPHLVRLWDAYLQLRPNPVFFDVGANYGIHTYRLLAGGAKCYAFEPQGACTQFLDTVARLNGWDVNIQQCVLGSEEGYAVLYRSRGTLTSSTLPGWVSRWDDPDGEQTVPRTTLDAFCESSRQCPDLIKIDVEGAESSVIAGASRCLLNSQPTLVIETMPETGSRDSLWERLVPLGYKVCEISGARNAIVDSQRDFAGRRNWDFLFTVSDDLLHAIVQG
jgi:FkbM family methyltransferase